MARPCSGWRVWGWELPNRRSEGGAGGAAAAAAPSQPPLRLVLVDSSAPSAWSPPAALQAFFHQLRAARNIADRLGPLKGLLDRREALATGDR